MMARAAEGAPRIEVRSRAELRDWLAGNHGLGDSVWLVTFKKHMPDYLPYGDLIEELLCWGWIDSQTRGVDADRTSVLIAPRNPKSAWSAVNKAKVEAARASGAMTEAGERLVRIAQENGMWTFLDDVDRLEVPDDLAAALGDLRAAWDAYPRSVRRGTLEWIKTAKADQTRATRIAGVVTSLHAGLRPPPFRR
ncbi:YdeI/OmpD-associated family protein [Palleronia sp. KMU-117]|uniref:YdeI/OmpD-associated family protein n=1 Tax=Palleronia sp. KMU-117 TaxID=3434108 RepID=UPI003D759132